MENEDLSLYFHEKVKFEEQKEQIAIGLASRDLPMHQLEEIKSKVSRILMNML